MKAKHAVKKTRNRYSAAFKTQALERAERDGRQRLPGVSRSGYYEWRARQASAREEANARLVADIGRVYCLHMVDPAACKSQAVCPFASGT